MGISHSNAHKRKKTGGRKKKWRKSRKYDAGRQPSKTKLATEAKVIKIRTRGGNRKLRALRLTSGNFLWKSEVCLQMAHINDVVYHPHSNEITRTKTLVRGAIVQLSALPFKEWYKRKYGIDIGSKTNETGEVPLTEEELKQYNEDERKKMTKALEKRKSIDPKLMELFQIGKLLGYVSTRPGQVGTADGYLLEGRELDFYKKKLVKKKSGQKET